MPVDAQLSLIISSSSSKGPLPLFLPFSFLLKNPFTVYRTPRWFKGCYGADNASGSISKVSAFLFERLFGEIFANLFSASVDFISIGFYIDYLLESCFVG